MQKNKFQSDTLAWHITYSIIEQGVQRRMHENRQTLRDIGDIFNHYTTIAADTFIQGVKQSE